MESRRVKYAAARPTLGTDFARGVASIKGSELTARERSNRVRFLATVVCSWAGMLIVNLYLLQVVWVDKWRDRAAKQHSVELKLASERGPILDRNNKLLAVSVPAGSIFAHPKQIKDKKQVAQQLADVLEIPKAEIFQKLNSTQKFVWVERQVERAKAKKVRELKIPGVDFYHESKRFYPYNHAASPVLGKVGVDGVGLSGVERAFERLLNGGEISTKVTRDGHGNMIHEMSEEEGTFSLPKGESLRLTLDAAIQMIMEEELDRGMRSAQSKAAMGVMIDTETGEILAMSQAPSVNLNTARISSGGIPKNKVVETVFEPGSILKPIVAAAAIDAKVVGTKELVHCENGKFKFGSHPIKDDHPEGLITFHDVVVRSSNIGMTKVGDRLGKERLYESLQRFGFGQVSKLGLLGETRGILRPVGSWAKVDVATHSYGHGVAVTPLQIIRAIAALVNDGKMVPLTLVQREEAPPTLEVVSSATAAKVRDMLVGVVTDEKGTGRAAAIPGIVVGGKTGTARKPNPDRRGYIPGAYFSSFVGFAEASAIGVKQKLALIVTIDQPSPKVSIYGGAVAAPVFKRIMQRTLHLLSTRHELVPTGTTAGTYPGYG